MLAYLLILAQLLPLIGVNDTGVFNEYSNRVRLKIPPVVTAKHTDVLIVKSKKVLILRYRGVPVKIYPVVFGFNPKGDKVKRGDGRTPEGVYFISEMLHKNLARRYGARSLRLAYPNIADARRGLKNGLINDRQFQRIQQAIKARRTPPQSTILGGSIRIHGGGINGNWTLGCVAMRDKDVIELYNYVRHGTPVRVVERGGQKDRDRDGIPDQLDLLIGAKKLTFNKAKYGTGYIRLKFPMGDVPKNKGVCTDVIVRAFRNAGIDLQASLNRHIRKNRRLYRWVKRPDTNIDQRRVKNLIVLFKARYKLVSRGKMPAKTYLPGDVVFMDTLPKHGPDHLGIISDRIGPNGYPLVINNWTHGYHTSGMQLLPQIPITHHFRMR